MVVSGLNLDELEIHAPDSFQVEAWLDEWVRDLKLPMGRSLVPLAQNWAFEKGFLTEWLGLEGINKHFFALARDTMVTANTINDLVAYNGGKPPFEYVGLKDLCAKLGVPLLKAHDALADALATAEVYKRQIQLLSKLTL